MVVVDKHSCVHVFRSMPAVDVDVSWSRVSVRACSTVFSCFVSPFTQRQFSGGDSMFSRRPLEDVFFCFPGRAYHICPFFYLTFVEKNRLSEHPLFPPLHGSNKADCTVCRKGNCSQL